MTLGQRMDAHTTSFNQSNVVLASASYRVMYITVKCSQSHTLSPSLCQRVWWSLNRPLCTIKTQVLLAVAYTTWLKCFHCTVVSPGNGGWLVVWEQMHNCCCTTALGSITLCVHYDSNNGLIGPVRSSMWDS